MTGVLGHGHQGAPPGAAGQRVPGHALAALARRGHIGQVVARLAQARERVDGRGLVVARQGLGGPAQTGANGRQGLRLRGSQQLERIRGEQQLREHERDSRPDQGVDQPLRAGAAVGDRHGQHGGGRCLGHQQPGAAGQCGDAQRHEDSDAQRERQIGDDQQGQLPHHDPEHDAQQQLQGVEAALAQIRVQGHDRGDRGEERLRVAPEPAGEQEGDQRGGGQLQDGPPVLAQPIAHLSSPSHRTSPVLLGTLRQRPQAIALPLVSGRDFHTKHTPSSAKAVYRP